MRTLVISDLHLGQHGGISVLERPRPLELLLEAVRRYDRLVLLGDIVEMQQSHSAYSFPLAAPVLRAIGETAGPGRQIVVVPGNHDHALIRDWSLAQGEALEREALVPRDASAPLSQVIDWLQPAQVEVRYPGVWLGDNIWATHGHYLNHYLRPVSSFGILHPRHRQSASTPRSPAEFEYVAQTPAKPHMRDGLPPQRLHDRLVPSVLAPSMAKLLARQMRHHSLPAFGQAAHALGVEADWMIFGHVHRLGPLPTDDETSWRGISDQQHILNTGSWRFEPVVCRHVSPPNPYFPGGAVAIDEDGIPRTVGLLDSLTERDFS